MNKEVKLVRLLSGEDILAEVRNTEHWLELTNPVVLITLPSAPGSAPNIGFAPWPQFADTKEIRVNRDHVVYETTPRKQFLDQYRQMNSKILTPTKGIFAGN